MLADVGPPQGFAPQGTAVAEPVPADYDGDGRAEPAWFRTADATWWINGSDPVAFGSGPTLPPLRVPGMSGIEPCQMDHDLPVPADYDGDGRADLATYSPRSGRWTVLESATGRVSSVVLRTPSRTLQLPVPADYDGTGRAQRALIDGTGWLIEGHAAVEPLRPLPAGVPEVLLPLADDVDGDGHVDRAYGELTPEGAIWRFGQDVEARLPGTPGPGIPLGVNPLLLTNIARLMMVGRGLDIACPRSVPQPEPEPVPEPRPVPKPSPWAGPEDRGAVTVPA